jgi:hypothetical protein
VRALFVVGFVVAAVHCGKSAAPGASASARGSVAKDVLDTGDDAEPMDAREAEAWARARDGDDEDRMRLADQLGCEGLRERASEPTLRSTAIRAMAGCQDFAQLPWLADLASAAEDGDAIAALESIVDQAARRRRATDPEDAEELHEGCGKLLALARAADRPQRRRVMAIRALRMLSERGCVKASDIPKDLDAK